MKLGVVHTRRNIDSDFFCNVDIAKANKDATEAKLKAMGIDFVNIDFLNPPGMIKSGLDAEAVAEYMIEQKVDALFTPHCNFGTEDAVARSESSWASRCSCGRRATPRRAPTACAPPTASAA